MNNTPQGERKMSNRETAMRWADSLSDVHKAMFSAGSSDWRYKTGYEIEKLWREFAYQVPVPAEIQPDISAETFADKFIEENFRGLQDAMGGDADLADHYKGVIKECILHTYANSRGKYSEDEVTTAICKAGYSYAAYEITRVLQSLNK